jgi:hypothetical protein
MAWPKERTRRFNATRKANRERAEREGRLLIQPPKRNGGEVAMHTTAVESEPFLAYSVGARSLVYVIGEAKVPVRIVD